MCVRRGSGARYCAIKTVKHVWGLWPHTFFTFFKAKSRLPDLLRTQFVRKFIIYYYLIYCPTWGDGLLQPWLQISRTVDETRAFFSGFAAPEHPSSDSGWGTKPSR